MNQCALRDRLDLQFPGGATVLMAVYAADNLMLFDRAVRSVYSNSLLPDAFILVVDGPVSDDLEAHIKALQMQFLFEVVWVPENIGLASALNVGLGYIKTEWVLRADADDFNIPERFSLQAAAIAESGDSIDIIGGAIREVEKNGAHVAIRSTPESHDEIVRFAAYRNPFNHMTVAFRTKLAMCNGGYPDIYLKEDYALWATLLSTGARGLNLSDCLVMATAGKEMYKRRGGYKYACAEFQLQMHLYRLGVKSAPMAIMHGSCRAIGFILPSMIRGFIYEKFLRRRIKRPENS